MESEKEKKNAKVRGNNSGEGILWEAIIYSGVHVLLVKESNNPKFFLKIWIIFFINVTAFK